MLSSVPITHVYVRMQVSHQQLDRIAYKITYLESGGLGTGEDATASKE